MARKKPARIATINATTASSARAVYAHYAGTIHAIEFTFVTEDEQEVVVTMTHEVAAELLEQGMHAYDAIQRPLRKAYRVPFG